MSDDTEIITCPDCGARYVMRPEKIKGKKFACKNCFNETGEIKVLRDYTGGDKS